MKFIVEVEDFYIEEGELSSDLKQHVTREVVNQISAAIKVKVEDSIKVQVNSFMEERMKQIINTHLDEFIEKGTITDGYDKKEYLIRDYLRNLFNKSHGWGNPSEKMQELAKKFGEECKLQYNNIFATKIVVQMKNQGFLKDDMAKILLEDAK